MSDGSRSYIFVHSIYKGLSNFMGIEVFLLCLLILKIWSYDNAFSKEGASTLSILAILLLLRGSEIFMISTELVDLLTTNCTNTGSLTDMVHTWCERWQT